jgi:23S rRNA U2552 (ribose-2'-O)-methylase RlmE/FtsJ
MENTNSNILELAEEEINETNLFYFLQKASKKTVIKAISEHHKEGKTTENIVNLISNDVNKTGDLTNKMNYIIHLLLVNDLTINRIPTRENVVVLFKTATKLLKYFMNKLKKVLVQTKEIVSKDFTGKKQKMLLNKLAKCQSHFSIYYDANIKNIGTINANIYSTK